jgi:hypothetical protein
VPSARVTFPLAFSQARAYHGPRLALLGDAAHSIHPQVPPHSPLLDRLLTPCRLFLAIRESFYSFLGHFSAFSRVIDPTPHIAFSIAYTCTQLQAGQGLNLGLGDAEALAAGVAAALGQGRDLGSEEVLGAYGRQRCVRAPLTMPDCVFCCVCSDRGSAVTARFFPPSHHLATTVSPPPLSRSSVLCCHRPATWPTWG